MKCDRSMDTFRYSDKLSIHLLTMLARTNIGGHYSWDFFLFTSSLFSFSLSKVITFLPEGYGYEMWHRKKILSVSIGGQLDCQTCKDEELGPTSVLVELVETLG